MIAIIDYDAGNLKSVQKALDFLHQECVITRDFHEIRQADYGIMEGSLQDCRSIHMFILFILII